MFERKDRIGERSNKVGDTRGCFGEKNQKKSVNTIINNPVILFIFRVILVMLVF